MGRGREAVDLLDRVFPRDILETVPTANKCLDGPDQAFFGRTMNFATPVRPNKFFNTGSFCS